MTDMGDEFEKHISIGEKIAEELFNACLTHHGVKGMHWGVRKEGPERYRFQASPKIDPNLHESQKIAASRVASLIGERYDFNIKEIKSFGPGDEEYARGTMGYVKLSGSQKREGTIFVSQDDPHKALKRSEKLGWVAKGCGTTHSFLTHEAAHAIFHTPQKVVNGKVTGGDFDARITAIKAAIEESKRAGIPEHKFLSSISGYAASSGSREEAEAELFSQYHWGTNPPSFVKVWGETLHKELGIDGTPFKERNGP